jgi:uncharacterized protein (TIGR02246 family)
VIHEDQTAIVCSAKALALSFVIAILSAAQGFAQGAADEISALLERWATTYGSAESPDEMLRLYAPDAVFFGTGGQTPFLGAEEFGPYFGRQFGDFSARKVSFIDPVIRTYDGTATATGLYHFEVTTKAGDAVDAVLRFSFALHRGEDGWIIVQHHSSQIPR